MEQKKHLMRKLCQELWVIEDKVIAIWGLAFKAGTDDIRESPALYFVPNLMERKAKLRLWDPIAKHKFMTVHPDLEYNDSLIETARGADAVLILTDWPEIAKVDLDELKRVMRCPIVADGRNMFEPQIMADHGFTYYCMGRPASSNTKSSR